MQKDCQGSHSQGKSGGKVRESQGIVREFGIVPKVREKSGNFIRGDPKVREKSGNFVRGDIFFKIFNDFYQISLAM